MGWFIFFMMSVFICFCLRPRDLAWINLLSDPGWAKRGLMMCALHFVHFSFLDIFFIFCFGVARHARVESHRFEALFESPFAVPLRRATRQFYCLR